MFRTHAFRASLTLVPSHRDQCRLKRWCGRQVGQGVCAVERGVPWMDTRQEVARLCVAIGYCRGGNMHIVQSADRILNYSITWSEKEGRPCQQQNVQNFLCSKECCQNCTGRPVGWGNATAAAVMIRACSTYIARDDWM